MSPKRPSSLTRNTTTPRAPARAPHLGRATIHEAPREPARPRPSYTQSSSGPVSEAKSKPPAPEPAQNGGPGISFKGAASGPYTVVAQNFAPGTTAADIESVMLSVGGDMTSCKLVAAHPTVIAEMMFIERTGAEKVIETFNGKKVRSFTPTSLGRNVKANNIPRLMAVLSTSSGSLAPGATSPFQQP